jgi:predicted Ser/Thr protein kinase
MPPSRVQLFGEIAISKGLLTQEQLDDALKLQTRYKSDGIKKTLGAVLHEQGALSLVQINAVMDEVAAERRRGSIEGYKILSKLGKGGMGSVYLARHNALQKLVAIKVLPPRLAANDEDLQRFKREALATAKLNHPNIVQAYDVGESNGYNYLVMEYVEGDNVKDLLDKEGCLDEARVVTILEALADALRHAWKQGIVHRDIKPANIVMTKEGVPKLLDLGLAISKKDDFAITQTGVIMGTPYYLSPEQARSEEIDIRSDIYSLGITLFHMLTGQPPFVGDSAAIIVSKHLTEPLPDPLEKIPSLSNGICYIISKMTAKERDERYQTPDELLSDILELRRLSYLRGKVWKPGPGGGRRKVITDRATLVRLAVIALAAAIPSVVLVGLTALEPDIWSRAAARLRGEKTMVSLDAITAKAAAGSEEHAAKALDEAEKYASEHPDDSEGARDRFAAIAREQGAASPLGAKANARVMAIDFRLQSEAQHLFSSLCREAWALRNAGKFEDAREALRRFPTRYARTPYWSQHERELELIDAAEEAALGATKAATVPASAGRP